MSDVESLSASLIREYLSRKGLKRSLRVLDEEFPRTENSIRNRVVLAKELKIEKMMRMNKELENPLRTMIEVMVKYFISDRVNKKAQHDLDDKPRRSNISRRSGSVQDLEKETSLNREMDLDRELEKALRITGDETSKYKPNRGRNSDDNFDINLDSKVSSSFGDIGRTQNHDTNTRRVRENERVSQKSNKAILEPVQDRSDKSKTRGHIQSTVDTTRRVSRKKKMDFIGNGFLTQDPELDLLSSDVGTRKDLDPLADKSKIKHSNNDDGKISRRTSKETDILEKSDKKQKSTTLKSKPADVMIFDDIGDEDFPTGDVEVNIALEMPGSRSIKQLHDSCKPITLEIATNLKTLIFGSSTTCFNSEWKNQSFSFCDLPDLEYGIVQLKGGPCGVLAAVQATLLKHLLFKKSTDAKSSRPLAPSSKERTMALADSLSEMLWRAGSRKSGCLVIPGIKSKFIGGGRYKSDGLTETLSIYSFKELENLKTFVSQNIGQFEKETSSGCILFVYSLILSRGIKRIQSDMDEPNGTLIGAHGYCTQELVNLCLTGKPVSNVFDGTIELDSGGSSKSVLKGIDKQPDIGLLSLFEHYGSCTVGNNYKTPKYPIWVVCSESHFSTLFSTNPRLLQSRNLEKHFDLYYYDGLARQDEEIRLTIDLEDKNDNHNDDLVPPLEHCIRTKWKNASVDWNNTEPIL